MSDSFKRMKDRHVAIAVINSSNSLEEGMRMVHQLSEGVLAVRHGAAKVEKDQDHPVLVVPNWSCINDIDPKNNGEAHELDLVWFRQQIPDIRWTAVRRIVYRAFAWASIPCLSQKNHQHSIPTWDDVRAAYRLGINPLPRLRELLPEFSVIYTKMVKKPGFSGYSHPQYVVIVPGGYIVFRRK